jgi:hypothetical protein
MGKHKKKPEPEDSDSEEEENSLNVLSSILNTKDAGYGNIKYCLYATAIFFVLSLPFTDKMIELVVPVTSSWLILLAVKTIAFFIFYYIITKFVK